MMQSQTPYLAGNHPILSDAEIGWVRPERGTVLRYAQWRGGDRGTIHILMGRAEAIEKYADLIAQFVRIGFSVTCHDWRGQGLSTRSPEIGRLLHVKNFAAYQHDIDAVMDQAQDLPTPRVFFCHDMGGMIAQRYLMGKHNISKTIYSAPMWRIQLSLWLRNIAPLYVKYHNSHGSLYSRFVGATEDAYEVATPFYRNKTTGDVEIYHKILKFLKLFPEFATGGPTYHWARAAHRESRALRNWPMPEVESLVVYGSREKMVDTDTIDKRTSKHNSYRVIKLNGGRHDLYVDVNEVRNAMWAHIVDFLRDIKANDADNTDTNTYAVNQRWK